MKNKGKIVFEIINSTIAGMLACLVIDNWETKSTYLGTVANLFDIYRTFNHLHCVVRLLSKSSLLSANLSDHQHISW